MSLSDPFQRMLKITTDSHVSPLDPCQRTLKNRFTCAYLSPLSEDIKKTDSRVPISDPCQRTLKNRFTCISFRPLSEDIKNNNRFIKRLLQTPLRFKIISKYIHVWLMMIHITHNVSSLLYDHPITSAHV